MSNEPRLALTLTFATVAAYLLTPVAISAAGRFSFYDHPRGYKGHAAPTPYLGGAAVLGGFLITILLLAGDAARTLPLAAGVVVLWAIGTIDDRRHLSPALRVVVEAAVAAALWAVGMGWEIGAGAALDLVLTIGWVLTIVNAFNLFDNMDGASAAMATVAAGAVTVLGVIEGDAWLTVVGAALAGSCVGFLPYNLARPRARIFLGDGGSMPIGFAVAVLVMTGVSSTTDGWQALAAGLLLVGVPAADTALVIISRRRKGISVLTGGRDHLTHRARRRLGTARAVALTLGALQAVVAAVALVALDVGPFAIIVVAVVGVSVVGAAITVLEREEDRLLAAGDVVIPEAALAEAEERRRRKPDPWSLGDLTLILFAGGAALSPLAFGFYASAWWVPVGLAVTVVAAMGAIRRPQRLPVAAWLVLSGLAALGLVALLSTGWASAADAAAVDANRWLVLAAIAGLSLVLLRSTRRDVIALVTLGLGTVAIGLVVIAGMLGDDATSLFLGGRLHDPLGYINAQATVFLMGVWLCVAGAERREAWIAGPSMAGAVLLAGLALLSQSRGAAIAAVVALVVVMLAVPGRERRALALLALAVGLAWAAPSLLDIYEQTPIGGSPPVDTIHAAARALVAGALVSAAAWTMLVLVIERLSDTARRSARQATRIGLALGVGALLVVGLVRAGSIADRLDRQWTAFTAVGQTSGPMAGTDASSRLASGAGNRYEYWRVAWNAFQDEPVRGIGAGGFDRVWFAERTITEDVRQPHSIELQVLSELGVVGGAALLLVLVGFGIAVVTVHRVADRGTARATVAVAAVGVPVTWLVHTSVDWQHLLPGTTAVALIMLAALARQPDRRPAVVSTAEPGEAPSTDASPATGHEVPSVPGPADAAPAPPDRRRVRPAPLLLTVAIALVVATTGATLTRQAFADFYREAAFEAVRTDPAQAIVDADRSLRLNPDAARSYYAKAAALARLNRGPEAAIVLRTAVERDPTNPVTWALRGDLAMRRGNERTAQKAYAQALALNPRDPGLQALAGSAPAGTGG